MARLGALVDKVRSKNAGPFWITLDVFCGTSERFRLVASRLDAERVAALFRVRSETVKRFELAQLAVIKFSLPRPVVQGSRSDRDMHGAGWAVLLSELEIDGSE